MRERLEMDPPAIMYQTASQIPDGAMAMVNGLRSDAVMVRTHPVITPMSISQEVQQALLADNLPVTNVRPMEQAGVDSTARKNFILVLLGLFAAFALLLAAVGIYGVVSYGVEQRTHEIGIRVALGANRHDILQLVLRQSLAMTVAGVGVGLAASFGFARLISAQLFGVKPADPVTFVAVPLILATIGIVAASIPALRASRVDPNEALRHE